MWRTEVPLSLTILLATIIGCTQHPSLEATLHWESEPLFVGVAVVDSADSDGLILIESDMCVQPMNRRLQTTTGSRFFNKGTFTNNDIAGATDAAHIWATCKRHDSLFVLDLSRGRELYVTHGVDRRLPAGWDGGINEVAVLDINGDGKVEVVVAVRSGFDTGGRGVYALDWESGRLLWRVPTGPNPVQLFLRDMDGDGQTEILVGTHAVANGDSVNGTDDAHTYVMLLSADGRTRWIRPIGRYASSLYLSSLTDAASRYPSIFVAELGAPAGGRVCDSVFVLDSRDGSVTARASYGVYNRMQAVLFDAAGHADILLGGDDDTLRLLDAGSLRLRRKTAIRGGISPAPYMGRNVVSRNLAIVPTMDGRLLVVAPNLQVQCEIPSGLMQTIHPVSEVPTPWFLATGTSGKRVPWRLYSLAPTPVLHPQVGVDVMVGVSLLLVAVFGATLVAIRYRQTYDMRTVIRGLTGQAGVVELGNRGQVRHTNARARALLGGQALPAGPLAQTVRAALAEPPGSQPKELPVALDRGKTVLARTTRVRYGVMLTLEDVSAVEYLQRVKAWAPVAQKLAHGIKNPLGTIMGAVEQIETEVGKGRTKAEARGEKREARSAEEWGEEEVKGQKQDAKSQDNAEKADERVRKYIGYVKDEVARLKKMTDAFMRFTKLDPPALEPKSINELVRKVVAKYEGALAKGISLELSLDERLPLVALDEEGIANVLDIVIENAVEAMDGRGQKLEARGEKSEVADAETKEHGAVVRVLRIRTSVSDSGSECHSEGVRRVEESRLRDPSTALRVTKGGGSHVRIEVEDTGMGIPQKYLDKVFEPYFTYGKADGTGLGLALAKKIVEDHRGRMEIESKEGAGTTVSIVLPAKEEIR